jgi:D-beta-D-heptose 7-phosphate kinase/D-beta-D-heptose 1-phosphate adenosyltransferase
VIVPTEELVSLRGAVAMVDGGFDPIHPGHITYFREAAALGAPVLCNISTDEWLVAKHPVLLKQHERAEIIDAIRYIDYTHLAHGSTEDVLRELRPRFYVKGADWRGRLPDGEVEICAAHGIEMVYLETVTNSSTAILERFERHLRDGSA